MRLQLTLEEIHCSHSHSHSHSLLELFLQGSASKVHSFSRCRLCKAFIVFHSVAHMERDKYNSKKEKRELWREKFKPWLFSHLLQSWLFVAWSSCESWIGLGKLQTFFQKHTKPQIFTPLRWVELPISQRMCSHCVYDRLSEWRTNKQPERSMNELWMWVVSRRFPKLLDLSASSSEAALATEMSFVKQKLIYSKCTRI